MQRIQQTTHGKTIVLQSYRVL